MERIERVEFLRKQIDRFLKLAEGTPDPAVSAELRKMANEYREMMDGHGSADGKPKPHRQNREKFFFFKLRHYPRITG
jgi:hypothetical protein